ATYSVNDIPLDLHSEAVWVHDQPTIMGERDPVDLDFSGPLVDFSLGDNSCHRVRAIGDGDASAADFIASAHRRGTFSRCPVCPSGCRIEDIDQALILQVLQTKRNGIGSGLRSDFIDGAFARKAARDVSRRSQIARSERYGIRPLPWNERRNHSLMFEIVDLSAAAGPIRVTHGRRFAADLA